MHRIVDGPPINARTQKVASPNWLTLAQLRDRSAFASLLLTLTVVVVVASVMVAAVVTVPHNGRAVLAFAWVSLCVALVASCVARFAVYSSLSSAAATRQFAPTQGVVVGGLTTASMTLIVGIAAVLVAQVSVVFGQPDPALYRVQSAFGAVRAAENLEGRAGLRVTGVGIVKGGFAPQNDQMWQVEFDEVSRSGAKRIRVIVDAASGETYELP